MLIFPGSRDVIASSSGVSVRASPQPLDADDARARDRDRDRDRSRSRRLERSLSPDTIAMRAMMIRYRLDPFTECGGEMGRRTAKAAKQLAAFPAVNDGPPSMNEFQVDLQGRPDAGGLNANLALGALGPIPMTLPMGAGHVAEAGLVEHGLEPVRGHGHAASALGSGLDKHPHSVGALPPITLSAGGMPWPPTFDGPPPSTSDPRLSIGHDRTLALYPPEADDAPPSLGLRLSPAAADRLLPSSSFTAPQNSLAPPRLPPLAHPPPDPAPIPGMHGMALPSLPGMSITAGSSSPGSSVPFGFAQRQQTHSHSHSHSHSQLLYPSPQAPAPIPSAYTAHEHDFGRAQGGLIPHHQRFAPGPGPGYQAPISHANYRTQYDAQAQPGAYTTGSSGQQRGAPGPHWQPTSLGNFRVSDADSLAMPEAAPHGGYMHTHSSTSEHLHGPGHGHGHGSMDGSLSSYGPGHGHAQYTGSISLSVGGSSHSLSADDLESDNGSGESEVEGGPGSRSGSAMGGGGGGGGAYHSGAYHPGVPGPAQGTGTANPKAKFQCSVCEKAFPKASTLQTHMSTHTGERPYECPVKGCGKRFSVQSNMRRHQKMCVLGLEGRKRIKKSLFADYSAMNPQPPGMAPTLEPLYATRLKVNRDAPVRKTKPRSGGQRAKRQTQSTPSRWIPESLKNCANVDSLCSKGPFQYFESVSMPLPPVLPRGNPGEPGWEERNSFEQFPDDPYLSENFTKLPGPGLLSPEEHMRAATMSRRWQ